MALEHGLVGPAADIYQRLTDALEHAGDYAGASATYDEAYSFCAANTLEPTAQLCLACLTVVLRLSGDWDRAATLCRQVIGSSDASDHARAVATGCAAALAQIAADVGQDEAMSALSHALGETALIDGSAEQAADQFAQALVLLQGNDAPFERAESQRRAAAALAAAGRREEAVGHLVAAYGTARRLGAKPLGNQLASALNALGERPVRRLGKRGATQLENGGLTRREVEIVRMVATGRTNREIAREFF